MSKKKALVSSEKSFINSGVIDKPILKIDGRKGRIFRNKRGRILKNQRRDLIKDIRGLLRLKWDDENCDDLELLKNIKKLLDGDENNKN